MRRDEVQTVERIRAELTTVERRIARLVEALADGMPVRAVKNELIRLEGRQNELKRQLAWAPELRPLLHPNLAEVYRARVAGSAPSLGGRRHYGRGDGPDPLAGGRDCADSRW
jgi:site-specific DNA recombinase